MLTYVRATRKCLNVVARSFFLLSRNSFVRSKLIPAEQVFSGSTLHTWHCVIPPLFTYIALRDSIWESPEAVDRKRTGRLQVAGERELAVLVDLLLDGWDESVALRVLFIDNLTSSKAGIVAHRCNLQGA